MTDNSKILMGIDPGTNYTGYGILDVSGKEPVCVVLGYIELNKIKDVYQKLRIIFERVGALIEEYKPCEVALESPFFGKNAQSMIKLGRAQGVAMASALTHGIPVFEYAPRKIKQAITGNGAASKEQVARLLQAMLKVEYTLKKLDATDGLAVAMCHYFESRSAVNMAQNALGAGCNKAHKKSVSWESFVADNPDREIKTRKYK
jgi:crossover junction endodeoxyribonuclease RuvC